ncbi:MAG: OsmC family protein [Gammaproteobacteria bacterium]|nr:OsmC family protein [Gammaproteobacteria bacterium]
MRARVKWLDHMSFVAESGSGHSVVMDGSPDHGGRNLGIRPMEMMLIGMGGCTAFDVALILQKSRQNVTSIEVELEAERADEIPAVFTSITTHFRLAGEGLSMKQAERAVKLSAEKYCSATRMLEPTVDINYTVEIIEG